MTNWMTRGVRLGLAALICGPVLVLGGGCGSGDGLPRQPVAGTVTLDGQPLAEGSIAFQPADPAGSGVAAGGTIRNGSYSISRADGPTPGAYRVAISSPQVGEATAKTKAAQPGDGDAPPARDLIPAAYNTATTLRADIVAGGNTCDFATKSR